MSNIYFFGGPCGCGKSTLAEAFMNLIYEFTKNYGITIAIITIAIRSCLAPLNIRQRKQIKNRRT